MYNLNVNSDGAIDDQEELLEEVINDTYDDEGTDEDIPAQVED